MALAALAAAIAAAATPAAAMQFVQETDGDTAPIIGRGEVIEGDFDRLAAVIKALPSDKRTGLILDSPGGLVHEAERMGQVIRKLGLTVIIPNHSKCVSACFLLFAAATKRGVGGDALIGVHSANENGQDTAAARAVTVEMARVAAEFDVPPAVLGKMVSTVPGRVEWLTQEDLVSMGVTFIDKPAQAVTPAPRPVARPAPIPVFVPPPAPAPLPTPTPLPAPALAPARLPPLRPPLTPAPAPVRAASAATVAEFQGAYFCGGATTLSLRVGDAGGDGRRRAVLTFAPTATNPQAGHGVFTLEGRLDLAGGIVNLQPVSGSAQPPASAMVGLVGRSDDGGRKFSGRVTASLSCTLFTMQRTR